MSGAHHIVKCCTQFSSGWNVQARLSADTTTKLSEPDVPTLDQLKIQHKAAAKAAEASKASLTDDVREPAASGDNERAAEVAVAAVVTQPTGTKHKNANSKRGLQGRKPASLAKKSKVRSNLSLFLAASALSACSIAEPNCSCFHVVHLDHFVQLSEPIRSCDTATHVHHVALVLSTCMLARSAILHISTPQCCYI